MQNKKKAKTENDTEVATKPAAKLLTMEKATANCNKYEGLFTLFQDTINGNVNLLSLVDDNWIPFKKIPAI